MRFLLVLLVKSAKCWNRKEQEKTLIFSPNPKSKSSEAVSDLSIHVHVVYTTSSMVRLSISVCVYMYVPICVCICIYFTYKNVYMYMYMYSVYFVDRLVHIYWLHTDEITFSANPYCLTNSFCSMG